jgi:hypothetical protein
MDPKAELTRIWKDMQMSAREFACYGLHMSSKALDYTATTLRTLESEFKKTAERIAPKPESAPAPEAPTTESPK